MSDLILLTMSTLPYRFDPTPEKINTYIFGEDQYEGYSQLEPIVKMMMDSSVNQEITVVSICSPETLMDKDGYNAYEYFKDRIDKYIGDRRISIKHECVRIEKDVDDSKNIQKALKKTVKKIRKWDKQSGKEDKFWVDNHGGPREIVMLMDALLSLLKIEGIVPDKVFNIRMTQGYKNPNYIVDITDTMDVFDFVSGMNAFIEYGDARILTDWIEKAKPKEKEKKEEKDDVTELLKAMQTISDATKLCDTKKYEEGCEDLAEAIQIFKKGNSDTMLNIFVNAIESDYEDVLDTESRNALTYVERSVKKGMYQQALTFAESRMPAYMISKTLKYDRDEARKKLKNTAKNNRQALETYLFNSFCIKQYDDFSGKKYKDHRLKQTTEKLSELYEQKRFDKWVENDSVLKEIESCNELEEEVEVKVINDELRKRVFFILHALLKKCRNLVNHTSNKERPDLKAIINCLWLYIDLAKEIVKES